MPALLAGAACSQSQKPNRSEANAIAAGQPEFAKGVDRSHKGAPEPDIEVLNGDGEKATLAAIADGKPMLVNLWASWCAPCVKELPTLDKLSQAPDGKVQVAAISQDMGPHASVEAFLNSHKISNLEAYQDRAMALSGALNAQVLPTSILYDSKGREVWRMVGDLDWSSTHAAQLLSEAS